MKYVSDDDSDEYSATEVAGIYARSRPKTFRKGSPGVIVMESLPYYSVGESSSSEDSMNAGRPILGFYAQISRDNDSQCRARRKAPDEQLLRYVKFQ